MKVSFNKLFNKPFIVATTFLATTLLYNTSLLALDIVSNGESEYTIVIPGKAFRSTKLAAKNLRLHLKKITGAKLPIVSEGKAPAEKRLFIGACDAAAKVGVHVEKPGAFTIATIDDDLYICGYDTPGNPFNTRNSCGTGSLYGVCELLRRVAGVRWLWPGESGTVINESPDFKVEDDFKLSDAPYFKLRCILLAYINPPDVRRRYALWFRRTGQGEAYSGGAGHAYSYRLGGNKYFDEHPEYYALYKGKRQPFRRGKHGWHGQICTSNPDVVKIVAESVLKSKQGIVSISPNDGYGFCQCSKCRALDDPENMMMWNSKPMVALSDRIFTFANAVAEIVEKKQPDKLLGHFAYTFFKQPPTRLKKLNDNIALFFAYGCHWYRDTKLKKKYRGYIARWSKLAKTMVAREYYGLCYWHDMPNIHTRFIDEDINFIKDHNFIGVHSEATLNFATGGVNYYFVAKKLWNPNLTRAEILDDYYKSGFGPAAADVAEYFDIFERRLATLGAYAAGSGSANVDHLDVEFDLKTIAKAKKSLDRAYAKTDDKEIRKRLDFVKFGYDYTVTTSRLIGLLKILNATGMSFSRLSMAKLEKELDSREISAILKEALNLHIRRWKLIDSQGTKPGVHVQHLRYQKSRDHWGELLANRLRLMTAAESGKALELPLKWRFKIEAPTPGAIPDWHKIDYPDGNWTLIDTNRVWERQGYQNFDGVGWYRTRFKLTAKQAAEKNAVLRLGAVDESCWIWVNGGKTGEFLYDPKKDENSWLKPQDFNVAGKLKPGTNIIALRVRDTSGAGGLWKRSFIFFNGESENLIANPSFENGLKGWSRRLGDDASVNVVDSDGCKSSHSLEIKLEKELLNKPVSINVKAHVNAGTHYSLTLYCKVKALKKIKKIKGDPAVRIIFLDKRGKSVTQTSKYKWFFLNLPENSKSWIERLTFFKTPLGTDCINITFFFHQQGMIRMDQVCLEAIGDEEKINNKE